MNHKFLFTLFCAGLHLSTLLADPAAAREVMARVDAQRNPESARSRMIMRIYGSLDASSAEREIRLISYARGQDQSLTEFVSPRSIAGMRILELDGAIRVYFPSTGRVRNIGGRARGGSVGGVGGDFSYEDMSNSGFLAEHQDFQLEKINDNSYQITARPLSADSAYTKKRFTIDSNLYIPQRIEYFDGDTHLKTLQAGRVREIGGRNVATELVMRNHAQNSRTEILLMDLEWDVDLGDDLFHPNRFFR